MRRDQRIGVERVPSLVITSIGQLAERGEALEIIGRTKTKILIVNIRSIDGDEIEKFRRPCRIDEIARAKLMELHIDRDEIALTVDETRTWTNDLLSETFVEQSISDE